MEADRQSAGRRAGLAKTIEHIGFEIYAASGAVDEGVAVVGDRESRLTRDQRERFYWEAQPLIGMLADVGIPAVAHHTLKTVASLLPFDPPGLFPVVWRIINRGARWGYQYESLAVPVLISTVRRYLAEYREVILGDPAHQDALIGVMDIFVRAEWPEAWG